MDTIDGGMKIYEKDATKKHIFNNSNRTIKFYQQHDIKKGGIECVRDLVIA